MKGLALILALGVITEALSKYIRLFEQAISNKNRKNLRRHICTLLISVGLFFAAEADIFLLFGITFSRPWIGILLSGILASRGSAEMEKLFSKLKRP